MADIAQLGFAVDTAQLKDAKASLDAIAPAADRVDRSAEKLASGFTKVEAAAAGIAPSVTSAASGMNNLTQAASGVSSVSVKAAAGIHDIEKAAGLGRMQILELSHVSTALFGAISAGINPFKALFFEMGRITQVASSMQGGFKGLGIALGAALLPYLPIILAVGTAFAVLGAAFGLSARKIKSDVGDVSKSMDLTKHQTDELKDHLDRLKDNKISVEVTGMDTFKAFFVTVGQYISEWTTSLFPNLGKNWTALLDGMTKYGIAGIKNIAAAFVGAFELIRQTWRDLPSVLGDLFYQAANKAIAGVNWLINKVVDGINALGGHMSKFDLGSIANPFSGAAAKEAQAGAQVWTKALDTVGKGMDKFGARWEANAKKIAQQNLLKKVGAPGSPEKAKADPWAELVTGGENDIASQTAAAKAVGLSAVAAATLEQRTKLLNEAQTKGIKLDADKTAKINELAAAYGKAKVAADNAKSIHEITIGAQKDVDQLKLQANAIGLVGYQLAYQTEMTKLLGAAEAAKLPVDAAMLKTFQGLSAAYATASAANDNTKYYTEATAAANENIATLKSQLGQVGMNAVGVARATEIQKIANDEIYRGIQLSPAQKQSLIDTAVAQARLTDQIAETKDAFDFVRSSATGFVSDLRSGLDQGKGFFKSFTDSVLNMLNKVIDKLSDVALDSAFGGNSSGLGGFLGGITKALGIGGSSAATGSSLSSIGAGSILESAKGDAFTNSVTGKATLYAYGRGGTNTGVLGEKGPEGVLPLKRGADGSLGVQLYGGAPGGGKTVNAPVSIVNQYKIEGAVSSEAIVGSIRQASEQTKADVKKQLTSWLNDAQRDGAVA